MAGMSRRSLLKLAGLGTAAGTAALGTGAAFAKTSAAQPVQPNDVMAHAAHTMGPVGRVGADRFNPTTHLRSWNFSHLPPAERTRFYRETPRPDGSIFREYELFAVDREIEIAPGIFFPAWTFNGQVPGPTLRATEGDRVRVTFVNQGSHPHTIHFHGWHPPEMDGSLPEHQVMAGDRFV